MVSSPIWTAPHLRRVLASFCSPHTDLHLRWDCIGMMRMIVAMTHICLCNLSQAEVKKLESDAQKLDYLLASTEVFFFWQKKGRYLYTVYLCLLEAPSSRQGFSSKNLDTCPMTIPQPSQVLKCK